MKCPRNSSGHDRPRLREDSHADRHMLKVGFRRRLPPNSPLETINLNRLEEYTEPDECTKPDWNGEPSVLLAKSAAAKRLGTILPTLVDGRFCLAADCAPPLQFRRSAKICLPRPVAPLLPQGWKAPLPSASAYAAREPEASAAPHAMGILVARQRTDVHPTSSLCRYCFGSLRGPSVHRRVQRCAHRV